MAYKNGMGRPAARLERPLSVNSNCNSNSSGRPLVPSPPPSSPSPARPKPVSPSHPTPAAGKRTPQRNGRNDSGVSGRVRVAVRLRPRNAEEMVADADFADCVELQPELKRLRLRKNNWDCETYEFDEVLTDFSSQKRVYEVVAKPVLESVLEGYNGTVMAYGQTGTGKTFTLGKLGEEDTSDRGIMVRAMEDILADICPEQDSVTVSYLQLYMETVQDLLIPGKDNIPIVEDPKTGDVSVPGATTVEIRDQASFVELLQIGEANRFAANTKLNTESSRSHAILMVNVKRHVKGKGGDLVIPSETGMGVHMPKGFCAPLVRKSKLVVVDLAGSERLDKSGSEGHALEEAKSINLSLTALGKCINALAEGSSHIPIRDSKLTRLLRDSFGGSDKKNSAKKYVLNEVPRATQEPAKAWKGKATAEPAKGPAKKWKRPLPRKSDEQGQVLRSENKCLICEQPGHIAQNCPQKKRPADSKDKEDRKGKRPMAGLVPDMVGNKPSSDASELCRACGKVRDQSVLIFFDPGAKANFISPELASKLGIRPEEMGYTAEAGSARTSLVVTIGPSPRHRGETTSTIMFGQRAMKVENMVKLKEEFDYKSLCRRLGMELERRTAEIERQAKLLLDVEEKLQERLEEAGTAEKNLESALEKMAAERARHQMEQVEVLQSLESERRERQRMESELQAARQHQKDASDPCKQLNNEVLELKLHLENESQLKLQAERELCALKSGLPKSDIGDLEGQELMILRRRLEDETKQRKILEDEIKQLRHQLSHFTFESDEAKRMPEKIASGRRSSFGSESQKSLLSGSQNFDAPAVGLQKVLSLLEAEDVDIRVHAVKVVANLAAEEANQEKIVEAGGLHSMLMLLNNSEDETIRRVAAGAIANLAMNETNQELIMSEGGIALLSTTADEAEDPQTLRMVAGAIANLCGNDKLQLKLRDEGGIRALLSMVKSRHADVLAQVARGIANFAKCESRGAAQGSKRGRSLLIDEGALPWIVANASNEAAPIRRHIELALCHLAQQDVNAKDLVTGGALWELVRISKECSREDIRTLAYRMLSSSSTFQAELRRLRIVL
ncbi:hypothetical protein L7F22_065822 [Adiantum nelumboides]|nr:hypothetical protein [Adiantum nelumboides]